MPKVNKNDALGEKTAEIARRPQGTNRAEQDCNVSITPSGFTVTFNKPFNPSVLNLYDLSLIHI